MKFNNFRSKLADNLEMPNNVVSDNFEMRIHGNNTIVIENHLGITIYEENIIAIKAKEQSLTIKGSHFKIEEINDCKIIVRGIVEEIKIKQKE